MSDLNLNELSKTERKIILELRKEIQSARDYATTINVETKKTLSKEYDDVWVHEAIGKQTDMSNKLANIMKAVDTIIGILDGQDRKLLRLYNVIATIYEDEVPRSKPTLNSIDVCNAIAQLKRLDYLGSSIISEEKFSKLVKSMKDVFDSNSEWCADCRHIDKCMDKNDIAKYIKNKQSYNEYKKTCGV